MEELCEGLLAGGLQSRDPAELQEELAQAAGKITLQQAVFRDGVIFLWMWGEVANTWNKLNMRNKI